MPHVELLKADAFDDLVEQIAVSVTETAESATEAAESANLSEQSSVVSSQAAARSEADAARALAAAANAQSSSRTVATWAALATLTGTTAGEGAEVLDTDTGTHTDPVVGGTVANAGRYSWSASPAGWRRIGGTGLADKASLTQLAALDAKKPDTVTVSRPLDGALSQMVSRPAALDFVSGGVVQTSPVAYRAPASGDCRFRIPLVGGERGATGCDVLIRVSSGAGTITVDQRTAADGVIAGTAVVAINEGRGIWAVRGIVLQGTFSHFRVRVQNAAAQPDLIFEAPVIVRSGTVAVDPARSGSLAAADLLAASKANGQRNLWSVVSSVQSVGTGSIVEGRNISVPFGNVFRVRVSASAFAPSDQVTFLFHASQEFRFANSFDMLPATGISGGAGVILQARIRALGGGWYMAERSNSEAGAGAQAAYFEIVIDNRNGAAGQSLSQPLVITECWIGRNVTDLPSMVSVPAAVMETLASSGVLTVFVDPAGSDSASGSRDAPVQSVTEAMARGASRVMLRKSATPHRISAPLAISGRALEFIGYTQPGDTATHANVWGSVLLAHGAFTATAADPLVYFAPLAAHPGGIWQVQSGAYTRFGRVQADPDGPRAPFAQAEANEVAVRAGAGRWWWGAGSAGNGLYLRPAGDIWTGISFEVPVVDLLLPLTDARPTFDGVEFGFARKRWAELVRSTAISRRSRFGRTGDDSGIYLPAGASHWLDEGGCEYFEAGNDNISMSGGGGAVTFLGLSISYSAIGDGLAPHGNGNRIRAQGLKITGNGKQGFVDVGISDTELIDCDFRGNAERDLLIIPNIAGAARASIRGLIADEAEISIGSATSFAVSVDDHRGPLTVNAQAKIRGHRVVRQGLDALRVDGGTVDVEDFYYSGASDGVDLRGGTLTLRTGQVLRCAAGIRQSGGTLVLDAAAPVDLFENVTQFVGVSAADQAKTLCNNARVATAAYDPPSLEPGSVAPIQAITVLGAALGDRAEATFSLNMQGVALDAWVSAADTVSYQFRNPAGAAGSVDLGAGSVRVSARRG